MRLPSLLLLLALAAPPPALADEAITVPPLPGTEEAEPVPATGPRVLEVRDRRAGSLGVVRKQSKQVSIIRDGKALPAENGAPIQPEDAVRTALGTVRLELPWGEIEVGERSQLRLAAPIVHRLGDAIFRTRDAAISIQLEHLTLDAEPGATFRVVRDIQGNGTVMMLEGVARLGDGVHSQVLEPGQSTRFSPTAVQDSTPASDEELAALQPPPEEQRAEEQASAKYPTRADRFHLRVGGGFLLMGELDFIEVGIRARLRVAGPVWFSIEGDLGIRPGAEATSRPDFVGPLAFGVRLLGDLGGSFVLVSGIDFSLVLLEHCVTDGCFVREFGADPGIRGVLGTDLLIARHMALEFLVGAGVERRVFPPPEGETEQLILPSPRVDVSVGLVLRL